MTDNAPFNLQIMRERNDTRGARLWSSIEELVDDSVLQSWIEAEFPAAAQTLTATGRREFLRLMGASLMLSALGGCSDDASDLALPYVIQPENETPGIPRYYATAVLFEGYAQPVLARTNAGRPTKLDGNPDHPASRGASDAFTQLSILQFYDPGRSKAPMRGGVASTWAAFENDLAALRQNWSISQGKGLRILTGRTTSPTLIRQLNAFLSAFPHARVHVFEPATGDRSQAMRLAFGRDADAHYAFDRCEVIVSIDDDPLGPGSHQLSHARGWAERRGEAAARNRLHVAESVPSLTGAVATTRLPVDASRLPLLAVALVARLGIDVGASPTLSEPETAWVERAAKDLQDHAGRSLLIFGASLPPEIQGFAPAINQRMGNLGQTVTYTEPLQFQAGDNSTVADLTRDMAAGAVDTLIMLDANPVYATPAELRFANLLRNVQTTIHTGVYNDETGTACYWHLPLSHALESWGDARAVDGTVTLLQPLLQPLYSTRSADQIAAMLAGSIDPEPDRALRETWSATFGDAFADRWEKALHDGFVADTALPPLTLSPQQPTVTLPAEGSGDIDIVFRPDPTVWDGRFGNVAWLQELPKPLTKITWDCPIAVSPRIGDRLGLSNGDLVEVSAGERSVRGAAWIMPGQAPNTVALFLGYGRKSGEIASGLGYSAFTLRPADSALRTKGSIRRVEGHSAFATTQLHQRMEGFDFVKEVTAENPKVASSAEQASFYPAWDSSDYAWGMVIDTDRCIGCNACVAACNVENNVLVVGKDQVAMGREMLWLRIDRYYTGDVENPRSYFQPVPCMHCEQAPCEMGCPVNATVHSPEGVNQQVYNRCIGTRTCSSYCPYKVRRFNWYDYRHFDQPTRAAHNPDVTVRSRGVMEKCSYCIQRIEGAHAAADKETRNINSGEVVTACQQACPTKAITFGNIKNSEEEVAKLRQSGRHYALLEHLGTRPRTTYLARWNDADKGGDT
jgi:molybdopterin-containing oxidoreductase family iron-sulfur binding subunit